MGDNGLSTPGPVCEVWLTLGGRVWVVLLRFRERVSNSTDSTFSFSPLQVAG